MKILPIQIVNFYVPLKVKEERCIIEWASCKTLHLIPRKNAARKLQFVVTSRIRKHAMTVLEKHAMPLLEE